MRKKNMVKTKVVDLLQIKFLFLLIICDVTSRMAISLDVFMLHLNQAV